MQTGKLIVYKLDKAQQSQHTDSKESRHGYYTYMNVHMRCYKHTDQMLNPAGLITVRVFLQEEMRSVLRTCMCKAKVNSKGIPTKLSCFFPLMMKYIIKYASDIQNEM